MQLVMTFYLSHRYFIPANSQTPPYASLDRLAGITAASPNPKFLNRQGAKGATVVRFRTAR